MNLLTVCGSLQERSANRAALHAIVAAMDALVVDDFRRLGELPAFDVDHAEEPIEVVDDWRRRIDVADAVLVAVPEYAGGMSGVLKNAFDWIVGSGELYRKPVAVLSAGTSGGSYARKQTVQTLSWQGAYVVAELGIAAPRTKFDADGHPHDAATRTALGDVAATLISTGSMTADDIVALTESVVAGLGVDISHIPPPLA